MDVIHPSHQTSLVAEPDGEWETKTCLSCGARSLTDLKQPCTASHPELKECGSLRGHALTINNRTWRGTTSAFVNIPGGAMWVGVRLPGGGWVTFLTEKPRKVTRAGRDRRALVEGTTDDGRRFEFLTNSTEAQV